MKVKMSISCKRTVSQDYPSEAGTRVFYQHIVRRGFSWTGSISRLLRASNFFISN